MSTQTNADELRPSDDSVFPWRWSIGVVRLVVLGVIAAGAFLLGDLEQSGATFLLLFYLFGSVSAVWHVLSMRHATATPHMMLWAQVLVDMGVVAATINFTGGPESVFTFLFVVVILEAGLLLGVTEAYGAASLASLVMLLQVIFLVYFRETDVSKLTISYNLLVQTLAYFLTASISGYWYQQLRRLQQFQREILDNMNNGFMIVDSTGAITAMNRAGYRTLDMEEGTGLGRPVAEVLAMASDGECPVMTALRLERDYTRYEFRCVAADSTVRLLGLSTSSIRDWRNRLTGIIVSFSDLTEMAEMQRDLQKHDRLAAIGELAAGLAHEIRNPVAAIRGAVDELKSCDASSDMHEKLRAIALRESDHLNAIVSDFLDFARNPVVRRAEFDVCSLVREVADLVRGEYGDAEGLAIEVHVPDHECLVSGDRTQIKQVFVNLAKNGVDAMSERGALAIGISLDPKRVQIQFDDEGVGIDPDKVARIFEPFYTTKASGVGMGLAICQRIVTSHDGTIHASSREGGGTSMIVRFPVARSEQE